MANDGRCVNCDHLIVVHSGGGCKKKIQHTLLDLTSTWCPCEMMPEDCEKALPVKDKEHYCDLIECTLDPRHKGPCNFIYNSLINV